MRTSLLVESIKRIISPLIFGSFIHINNIVTLNIYYIQCIILYTLYTENLNITLISFSHGMNIG